MIRVRGGGVEKGKGVRYVQETARFQEGEMRSDISKAISPKLVKLE